jgi:hypothetical protein
VDLDTDEWSGGETKGGMEWRRWGGEEDERSLMVSGLGRGRRACWSLCGRAGSAGANHLGLL